MEIITKETKDTDSFKTIGAHVVRAGSTELYPHSDTNTRHIKVESFKRRQAKAIYSDMFEKVAEMAGEELRFRTRRFTEGAKEFKATWGKVDLEAIKAAGTSVEFAGPTDRHKGMHMLPEFIPDHVTNVTRVHGGIDAFADVRDMPFGDESLGSVHISCLPAIDEEGEYDHQATLRIGAIKESARVLKEGGFLVWDGGTKQDFDAVTSLGLEPVALAFDVSIIRLGGGQYTSPSMWVDGVYRKPFGHEAV